MSKSSTINSRIEPDLKAKAEAVFAALGLSTSEALTLFYKQVELHNGLPFEVRIPNKQTIAAMRELQRGKRKTYANLKALLDAAD